MFRRDHIRPSGRSGRAARLAVSSVFTGLIPIIFLVHPTASDLPVVLHYGAGALIALTTWLWVRLPFTGVSMDSDFVTASSWWSVKRIPRVRVRRFRSKEYAGPFYYLAWAIDDGPFASGEVCAELRDGSCVTLRASVCSRRVSRQLVRALNDRLGVGTDSDVIDRATTRERGQRAPRDAGT